MTPTDPNWPGPGPLTRRELLARVGTGFGALALGGLMAEAGELGIGAARGAGRTTPLAARPPQFAPKARRVIHLFMNGGPSQVDTFDPKPALTKYAGKPLPNPLATENKTGAAFASPFKFKRYGRSGIEVSEIFDRVGGCIDDICVVRSMHADVPNHLPSLLLMNCGEARQPRPSLGSWALYGLGTENQNLPGFLVMCPGGYPNLESQNWQAGFLPGVYQGTYVDSQHTNIERLVQHIRNRHLPRGAQRDQLDLVLELNKAHQERHQSESELEARIQSFELAFRMQSEAGDAFDVSREPEHVRNLYGPGVQARQLLIARRLLERGVRYIQVWHGAGQPWDSHDNLAGGHRLLAQQCDQGIAALLTDLKQRGMLEDTLVMWGGEFGRTPTVELPIPGVTDGKLSGRDHNHHGFSMWLAGGGVKGGHVHGATDEFGFQAVEDRVHVHDLHATVLHLLGFDHETFTFRHAGRDFRLTDVHGKVVRGILA